MNTIKFRKTLKSIAVYNLASVLPAAIGFLITPLLSHYLKPSDYGIVALISTYLLLVQPIVGFVASGLITVEYFKMKDKPPQFSSLFSSILLIPILPVVFLSVITYLYFYPLCNLAGLPVENKWIVVLVFFVAFLVIINETLAAYLVVKKKYIAYAIVSVSKAIVEVGLTLLFVIKKGMGWEGRIYALYTSTLFLSLAAFFIFFRERLITLNIRRQYIYAGLSFGSPLIFHMFGKFAINQSDRVFLAKMETKNELGIYNMAYMFGSLSLFYISALVNYLTPYVFERLAKQSETDKKEIIQAIQLAFLSLIVVALIVVAFSWLAYYYLIDRKYFSGFYYVPWIALSYIFWGGYNLLSSFYFYAQKTKFLGALGMLVASVNLLLNYLLIFYFGTFGAVISTLVSFMLVFFVVLLYSKKIFNVRWLART